MKIIGMSWNLALLLAAPVLADQKADELIEKARQVAGSVKSLEGTVEVSTGAGASAGIMKADVQLLKPSYGRVHMKGIAPGEMTLIFDATTMVVVVEGEKQYMEMPSQPQRVGLGPGSDSNDPMIAFLFPDKIASAGKRFYAGRKTVAGSQFETVKLVLPAGDTLLYLDDTGLLVGTERSIPNGAGPAFTITTWLRNIKRDSGLTADNFVFTPPAGFKKITPPAGPSSTLLKIGGKAPDFTIPMPQGGSVRLAKTVAARRATIINFWFYG